MSTSEQLAGMFALVHAAGLVTFYHWAQGAKFPHLCHGWMTFAGTVLPTAVLKVNRELTCRALQQRMNPRC